MHTQLVYTLQEKDVRLRQSDYGTATTEAAISFLCTVWKSSKEDLVTIYIVMSQLLLAE